MLERWWASTRGVRCPPWRPRPFTGWFARHRPPTAAPRGEVVLFHDTFVTYNTPAIGQAAVALLEQAGYRVVLADKKCCGRPDDLQGAPGRGARARALERRAPAPVRRARRAHRGAGAVVPAHPARRVRGSPAHGRGTGGRARQLSPRGVPGPRAHAWARAPLPRPRPARPSSRPLPPEGDRGHGPHGGGPPVGRLHGGGGRLGLLRHGRLLRLREGALRHLGRRGQSPARARREGRAGHHGDRGARESPAASRSITSRVGGPGIPPRSSGKHSRAEPSVL